MPRLYCIDASIYIFRAYFSYPDRWHSPDGYSLNAVYGFLQFLLKLLEEAEPEYALLAFDESLGSCFRHDIYPDYKSNRVLPDEALAFQLDACAELSGALGFAGLGHQRYEADDLIASAAEMARGEEFAVTVVTRDKDLAQVLKRDDDHWWNPSDSQLLNRQQWQAHNELRTDQVADWLALKGDSIDCIPGVPGVGDVTAKRLLQAFDDIDTLYQRLGEVPDSGIRGAKRIQERLEQHRDQVMMARELSRLCESVTVAAGTDALAYRGADNDTLASLLSEWGFADGMIRQTMKRVQQTKKEQDGCR